LSIIRGSLQHFTLKTNPLKFEDLKDFIKCYNPENRHQREENERFKAFSYEELVRRDKAAWTSSG